MRLQLLLMQLLLCVLPGMEIGRFLPAYRLGRGGFFRKKWKLRCIGDTMDIVSPDGLSLWYKERLTGNYEITYRVQVVVENGSYDRLSDLNCFWGPMTPGIRMTSLPAVHGATASSRITIRWTFTMWATAVMIMELRVSVNTMESIMEWTMQRLNPS